MASANGIKCQMKCCVHNSSGLKDENQKKHPSTPTLNVTIFEMGVRPSYRWLLSLTHTHSHNGKIN